MRAFHDPETRHHAPEFMLIRGVPGRCFDVPARSEALVAALAAVGIGTELPPEHTLAAAEAVHDRAYLAFLATAHERWSEMPDAGPEVIPNMHPIRQVPATKPTAIAGEAGWYMGGSSCPITAYTWAAARRSADSAIAATEAVMAGDRAAYALCRPPGHHAYADMAGGFCYLNNAAIAAEMLRGDHARVAILDIDIHHGNGTQGIFWHRGDVMFVSVHADPAVYYPWYWGHAHETGAGAGTDATVNLPLPLKAPDSVFIGAVSEGLQRIEAFDPGALVLSLGLDAHEDDPLMGGGVSTEGFRRIGEILSQAPWPTVIVQEGGYLTPALGLNLEAFLRGYLGR